MKKIFKSFTFWFLILSILIIFLHQIGQDSKSIILIGFNPLLRLLPNEFMNSGPVVSCNTISGNISIYWYIASIISFIIYGGLLDLIKKLIKIKRA